MDIQPTAIPPASAELSARNAAPRVAAETPASPNTIITAPAPVEKTGTNPASNEDVKSAVRKVATFMEQQAVTDLSFSVDDETNIRVIKVVDRSTKEVIRQIPSEEMLQMAQALDKLQGLLLKQKA